MGQPTIAVLERNRAAGTRIARIASAAGDLARVVWASEADALPQMDAALSVIACDLADLEGLRAPGAAQILVWTADIGAALAVARADPRVRNIVGWPSFAGIPRAPELALVIRRLLAPRQPLPALASWFPWGAHHASHRVGSSLERDELVQGLGADLRQAGVSDRSAARAAEVAHELLTNAMYVAPVDSWGRPRFAHQRASALELTRDEAPTLELAFDGQQLAIEVQDRFGRLDADQVLASLQRGRENARAEGAEPALDPSNGGAGLGLGLVHASAVSLVIEVVPGRSTRVVWQHDVELAARDYRSLPASVHLFRTAVEEIP